MIGIQALTGLNPKQLLEDADTGEIIWQHQAMLTLVRLLNKMVRYHQRPLPVSDRSTASAATTSRALLANTASCSSTITNRYSTPPAQKLGQDNMPIPGNSSSVHLAHTNDPAVPNKSALLIGIAAEWFQL